MGPLCTFEKVAAAVAEQLGNSHLDHIFGDAYFSPSGDIVFLLGQDERIMLREKQNAKPSTITQPRRYRFSTAAQPSETKSTPLALPHTKSTQDEESVTINNGRSMQLLLHHSPAVSQPSNKQPTPLAPPPMPNIHADPHIESLEKSSKLLKQENEKLRHALHSHLGENEANELLKQKLAAKPDNSTRDSLSLIKAFQKQAAQQQPNKKGVIGSEPMLAVG